MSVINFNATDLKEKYFLICNNGQKVALSTKERPPREGSASAFSSDSAMIKLKQFKVI